MENRWPVLALALAFLSISINLSAQNWDDLLQLPNATFKDVQKAYYTAHPETSDTFKVEADEEDGMYSKFKRWEAFVETRLNAQGIYDPTATTQTYQSYLKKYPNAEKAATANWSLIGPTSPPGLAGYNNDAMGRIDCFGFHPTDPDTYWAGAPSGGLWKTTDNGQNWSALSDMWGGLGIADIYIHNASPDTIIVATGTRDGSTVAAFGILRSIDQGATFQNIGLVSVNRFYRLLANPADADYMVAATNMGAFYSEDGGANWHQSIGIPNTGLDGIIWDMEANPCDFNIIYTSSYGRFYKSIDAGKNFVEITLPFPAGDVSRTGIAVTKAADQQVYLSCVTRTGGRFYGLYKSGDTGDSFVSIASPLDSAFYMDGSFNGLMTSAVGTQGSYDWTISVSPSDTNEIYIGGVSLFRTTTGKAPWTNVSSSLFGGGSVHVDMHITEYHPITGEFYVGCDGGIYRYTGAAGFWDRLMDGLAVTQNYRLGQSTSDENLLMIGNQDNGIMLRKNGQWFFEIVGDGMESIVDPYNPDILFALTQNGRLLRSTIGGGAPSWSVILQSLNTGQAAAWTAPFEKAHNTANTYFIGYQSVWKTVDGGDTFINTNANGQLTNSTLRTLAIAPSDENIIYTSDATTHFFRTSDGGINWDTLTAPSSYLTDITIHPAAPSQLWACGSNKVFFSNDSGENWSDVSGSLPDLSINTIVYQERTDNGLYVGTDVGIFYKDDTLGDWLSYSTGLPNVIVNDLEINCPSGKIRAATYGRSIWESDLYSVDPIAICCSAKPPDLSPNGDLSVCGSSSVTLNLNDIPSGYQVEWLKNDTTILGQTGSQLVVTENDNYAAKYIALGNYCFDLESDVDIHFNTCKTEGCENVNRYSNQGPGNITQIWIEGPFAEPSMGANIEACILMEGDFNDASKQFKVYDENGGFIMETNGDAACKPSTPQCFNISMTDFNTWAADGEILFEFDPVSTGVDPLFCNNNRLCVSINYAVENDCFTPDTLLVDDDPILSDKYKAQELILSNGRVPQYGNVEMKSAEEISLDTNFEVELGSYYYALIDSTVCQLETHPSNIVINTKNSGYGSLRSAIYFANTNYGLDTILFNIPGTPPHVIQLKNTLPRLTDDIVIDGTSQPLNGYGGTSPRIVLDGNTLDTCGYCSGISFRGEERNEIYGLTVKNFPDNGLEMIQNNLFSVDTTIIGAAEKGNVIAGNGSPSGGGLNLFIYQDDGECFFSIKGNTIGVYEDGSLPITQGHGLLIRNFFHATSSYNPWQGIVGGHLPGEGNVFGGSIRSVETSHARNIWFMGNRFNVDPSGNYYSLLEYALPLANSEYIKIGGPTAAHSNLFSGYTFNPIRIFRDSTLIERNRFFCNPSPLYVHTTSPCNGAVPTISSATDTSITGTAAPGDIIQVYLNHTCSGPCQGEFYIGQTVADGSGNWTLSAPFEHPFSVGDQVTANATRGFCTSVFSGCVNVTSLQPPKEEKK